MPFKDTFCTFLLNRSRIYISWSKFTLEGKVWNIDSASSLWMEISDQTGLASRKKTESLVESSLKLKPGYSWKLQIKAGGWSLCCCRRRLCRHGRDAWLRVEAEEEWGHVPCLPASQPSGCAGWGKEPWGPGAQEKPVKKGDMTGWRWGFRFRQLGFEGLYSV